MIMIFPGSMDPVSRVLLIGEKILRCLGPGFKFFGGGFGADSEI